MKLHAFLFTALLAISSVSAQAPDFTKGFEQLYALGLPDVSNAEYVYFELGGIARFHRISHDLYDLNLSGNAWLLEETEDSKKVFITKNCVITEIDTESTEKRQDSTTMFGAARRSEPTWRKADLAKDISAVIEYMKQKTENPERHDWTLRSGGYGSLLLMAAHFHKKGYTEEANEITGMLFTHAGDNRKVITQAFGKLAEGQYENIYQRFNSTGDWAAFLEEIEALLEKYSTGWETEPAMKRLAERVAQRIEQETPPEIVGDNLTDEDIALAMELATIQPAEDSETMFFRGISGAPWTLPATKKQFPVTKESDNVIDRIEKRGMKSVPLLIALLKNDYLTMFRLQDLQGHSFSFHHSTDRTLTEEQITSMYNSMQRPASLSDIAMHLLKPIIIFNEPNIAHQATRNADIFYETCVEWYEEMKNATPSELALSYLEGDHNQQQAAIAYLIESGNEPDLHAIEKHFLESEDPMSGLWQTLEYVMQRGEKAGEFVEKFIEVLEKTQPEAHGTHMTFYSSSFGRGRLSHEEEVNKAIQQLRAMVSENSLSDILRDVSEGTKNLEDYWNVLGSMARRGTTDENLKAFLEAALNSSTPDTKAQLVSTAMHIVRMSDANEDEDSKIDITATAELWKKLLTDNEQLEPSVFQTDERTVADAAAWSIEYLYGDPEFQRNTARLMRLGAWANQIMVARAEARLAGKSGDELPQFPSADTLTSAQKDAITAKIKGADPDQLQGLISELTLDERLALDEQASSDPELSKRLAPVAQRIVSVRGKISGFDAEKEYAGAKGSGLTREMVEKALEACRTLTREGLYVQCAITRKPLLDGIEIVFHETPRGNKFAMGMDPRHLETDEDKAFVTGTFFNETQPVLVMWPLETEQEETEAEIKESDNDMLPLHVENRISMPPFMGEDNEKKFWDMVESFCAGTDNVFTTAFVYFTGLPIQSDPEEKQEN